MIFITNKYTKYYFSIISNAKSRTLPPNTYIEKHHIIPKSLGGNNSKDNLVSLTAREHFVCHKLLVKMLEGKNKAKMSFAFWRLVHGKNNLLITSRTYQTARLLIQEANTIINNKPPNHAGKTWKEIYKDPSRIEERRMAVRKRMTGGNNHNYGVPLPEETKSKIRSTLAITHYVMPEEERRRRSKEQTGKSWEERMGSETALLAKQKVSATHKGKPKSEEHKNNLRIVRAKQIMKPVTEETKLKQAKKRLLTPNATCIHCGASMHPSHISRYHNEKCKKLL
jgi:hypothetical protein